LKKRKVRKVCSRDKKMKEERLERMRSWLKPKPSEDSSRRMTTEIPMLATMAVSNSWTVS
jgi:hypothetical protein